MSILGINKVHMKILISNEFHKIKESKVLYILILIFFLFCANSESKTRLLGKEKINEYYQIVSEIRQFGGLFHYEELETVSVKPRKNIRLMSLKERKQYMHEKLIQLRTLMLELPNQKEGYYYLGLGNVYLGNNKIATDDLNKYLEFYPDKESVYILLWGLYIELKEYHFAFIDIRLMKSRFNIDFKTHNMFLANTYFYMKEYEKVIIYTNSILRKNKSDIDALFLKAGVFYLNNKKVEADLIYNQLISRDSKIKKRMANFKKKYGK